MQQYTLKARKKGVTGATDEYYVATGLEQIDSGGIQLTGTDEFLVNLDVNNEFEYYFTRTSAGASIAFSIVGYYD